jgi:hypothetical protein
MKKFNLGNFKDPNSHLSTLTDEQYEQLQLQNELLKYYLSDTKNHLQVRRLPNGNSIDDNLKINLSRRVVDKGNNFLFGKGLNWQLDQTRKSSAEIKLMDVWGNQETQNSFLAELGLNGAIHGTYVVQIISKRDKTYLKNLDPKWVFITPSSESDEKASQYDLRWNKGDTIYRLLHTERDDLQWEYQREYWDRGKWNADSKLEIWPFEWPFILHGKNLPNPNSVWGTSDLEDADLNDSINQVSSNLNRIIRIFAHPVIWGTGFSANSLNVDISQVITSTNETAKLQALELARDLSDSQDFLKYLRTMFAEITNVPESDPDRLRIGAQSGFALQVLYNDLILKTGNKRNFYGKGLIELNRRILDLEGFGPDNQTQLYWPDPLPLDKEMETKSNQLDLEAGLASKETISTARGYDYESELERMAQESVNNTSVGEAILQSFTTGL